MKTKPTISFFSARVAMTLIVVMLSSSTAWASEGKCGPNLSYIYNTNDSTLTILKSIEGTSGSMYDYTVNNAAPWISIREQIKTVVIDNDVTDIGSYAFYGCTALKDVSIASTVTSIKESAFQGCSSLPSVNLPAALTRIDKSAFSGCWSLKDIAIPDATTIIEDFAFEGCSALTSISFPEGITNISEGVFKNSGLSSFTIPQGVTAIAENAFMGCTRLKEISIPNSVESIGISAFQGCDSLKSVTIPGSVESIGKAAFLGCSSLTNATISDGVKSIGESAFNGTSLTGITIPGSVESIGGTAFFGCDSLKNVSICDGVKSIGESAFAFHSYLTGVTIPGSVESIDYKAFFGCPSLTNVSICDGVKNIGEVAFMDCSSLTSVTIPESVESIGNSTFAYCPSLSSVYCYAPSPPTIDPSSFKGCASDLKIYVPEDCVDEYKSSWEKYRDRIVGIPVYTLTLAVSPDDSFGTATVSSTIAGQGDRITLTATPNPGYRFVWWESTGGGVITKPSAEVTTLTMPKRNVTLTAIFRGKDDNPNTYTLMLDDNDDNPFGMAEIHQGIKSLVLPTRTRTNYYFLGWATSATGGPAYQAGDTIHLEQNLTLYARWMKTPVELADNANNATTLKELKNLGAIDVRLTGRTLPQDGYWNTLCLPFDLHIENTPLAYATLMELDTRSTSDSGRPTGYDEATGTIYLNFIPADSIKAGKPYLIKWGTPITDPNAPVSSIYQPVFNAVKVSRVGSLTVTSSDGAVSFIGTFNPVALLKDDKSVLFLGDENTLYYPNTDGDLGAFRAYFRLTDNSEVNQVKIRFEGEEDEPTAIRNVSAPDRQDNNAWYNISGMRLKTPPSAPGIYIHNGKKYFIK